MSGANRDFRSSKGSLADPNVRESRPAWLRASAPPRKCWFRLGQTQTIDMSLSETLNACGIDRTLMRGITSEQLCEIEHRRPRIAASAEFQHSALNDALSPHTRMRCVFESIYLSCFELAEARNLSLEWVEHPSMSIVNAAASIFDLTDADARRLRALTEWAASSSPRLPHLNLEDACALARDVAVHTILFFAEHRD